MLIASVVGARPNFMKMAPVIKALSSLPVQQLFIHTGQHYDTRMSEVFFNELGLPEPDVYLDVGSGSHAEQTGQIMIALEKSFAERRPDAVLVAGDVNSSMAAGLVAAKAGIPLGHVEAGLRSFDRSMPEEINRVVVDHLSDLLFTTEASAEENLRREGISEKKTHFVGNCMVDSLLTHVERAVAAAPWEGLELQPRGYGLLTLHRPSNVDDVPTLTRLLEIVGRVSQRMPLVFTVHPRTRARIEAAQLPVASTIRLLDPLPYLQFLGLMARSRFVLTDSGGIQEETTVLDVPCLTLRANTERPVTVQLGTNRLVGTDVKAIGEGVDQILNGAWSSGTCPPLWDGRAGERIASVIQADFLT